MDELIQYSIPIRGLGNGVHEFEFHVDRAFFRQFEESPVAEGAIDLKMSLDKRPDLLILEFDFTGTVRTDCDRCLAEINLPVSGRQRLMVKFSEEQELEEAEVTYLSPEAQSLNVARYVYEFVILAIPMIKVYNCEEDEDQVCDQRMLNYLRGSEEQPTEKNTLLGEKLKNLRSNN